MFESTSRLPPTGFNFSGSDAARDTITRIATLLQASTRTASGRAAAAGHRPGRAGRAHPRHVPVVEGNYFLITTPGRHRRPDRPIDVARNAAAIASWPT